MISDNLFLKFFYFGIFLLPSAPSLSAILLLICLIYSLLNNFFELLKDKWNIPFFISIILMPLICLAQNNNLTPFMDSWNKSLTWIGLLNWLPLFLCFIGLEHFVKNKSQREMVGKLIIAGTFPVIVSGIGQYWFNWYGPFEFLNGLIIWFQRPLQNDTGLTGLFNNQNYAGSWFCIVWPFCLSAFLQSLKNTKTLSKYITISFLISITVCLILTTSRNAWGGLILLIPLMRGVSYLFAIFLITIIFLVTFYTLNPFITQDLQLFKQSIIPEFIYNEFSSSNFDLREKRSEIWFEAIKLIIQKPFIGWGAGSFPIIYFYLKEAYSGHPHNLIFELAISYGIPISIIIFIPILLICIYSFYLIFIIPKTKINNYERAWFASFFVLFCSQQVDIQYFDWRISIIFWILLSGLKAAIKEGEKNKNLNII